ncbi:MAG: T9SS type A sorting domain-containing protein [Bacteroidetes bacterium]|nr:T9SS type A sorting domain-containing protein [Bacteroidota bacterium]
MYLRQKISDNLIQLTITDLLGNIIITKNVSLANNNYSDVISTVNFASGVYMIKIATGEIQMVKQLVINK